MIVNMLTGEVKMVDFGAAAFAEKAMRKEFQGMLYEKPKIEPTSKPYLENKHNNKPTPKPKPERELKLSQRKAKV